MARFYFNHLIKKEQTELDVIKTALDIYQAEDKYAFERKKFKSENWRFFGMVVHDSIISLGSAYSLNLSNKITQQ
jgi:hypothetical protein